ncbi:hypothetical protein ACXX9E_29470 [Pseudomonas sp. GNP014]
MLKHVSQKGRQHGGGPLIEDEDARQFDKRLTLLVTLALVKYASRPGAATLGVSVIFT